MRSSASARAIACPASLLAPNRLVRSARTNAAAAFGHLAHAWVETGVVGITGASAPDIDLLERKILLSGIDRDRLWPANGEHEVTFAVHLKSLEVRLYKENSLDLDRDRWKETWDTSEWLTGTSDYETEDWLDDLKTGSWPVSPIDNPQLRSYALWRWLRAGRPFRYKRDVSITQWPKYPIVGLPARSWSCVTGFDLEEHLEALQWSVSHPTEYNITEEHCLFCQAKSAHKDIACPEVLNG